MLYQTGLKRNGLVRVFLLFYLFTLLPFPVIAEDVVRQGCRRGKWPTTPLNSPRGGEERRGPLRMSSPSQGKLRGAEAPYHQLVILVSFTDQQFKDDEVTTLQQWDKIFNAKNFTEDSFVGSVFDYFYAQSYGQFNVTFDLYYIALSEARHKYRSTQEDDENSQYLVDDLVDIMSTMNIDWSQYDWNGDGYVNQLLIVYAGKGSSYGGFGGGYDAIWPHQWWLSLHQDLTTEDEDDYRNYRIVTSGGQDYIIDSYCALAELSVRGDYGTFGTLCHEYSHCFGLPDFYYGSTKYVSTWDLMDYGNNNKGGFCPPNYSAHERMLMGWLTPVELNEAATIDNMSPTAEEPVAYLVRNDGYENEFYMVENRQQTGWDQGLPGSGLLVFHIDYDEEVWRIGQPNTTSQQRYVLFHANNSSAVAGWAYPYNDNNELTNKSKPATILWNANADGTMLMSKPITAITIEGGKASFDFMGGATAITEHSYNQDGQVIYRVGNICIVRFANGEVRKVMGIGQFDNSGWK